MLSDLRLPAAPTLKSLASRIGYPVPVCPGRGKTLRTSPAGLWSHGVRKIAQLGGALPGYTGFRDDRVDLLGQPFPLAGVASCVSNKTSIEK